MKEAWKVVDKKNRYGSNATAFQEAQALSLGVFFKEVTPIVAAKLRPYFPKYNKGSVVKCVKGSAGILCFTNRSDAERFRMKYDVLAKNAMIIKVMGLGRPMKKHRLISGCFNILEFTKDKSLVLMMDGSYPGTIAYSRVRVLE